MLIKKSKNKLKLVLNLTLYITTICYFNITFASSYFIDNVSGNDINNGTSEGKPWKTLLNINNSKFNPGDNIYLKRGQLWEGTLFISSSGIEGKPITFSSYGNGSNPIISRSISFSDWKRVATEDENKYLWTGNIPWLKNSWGIVIDEKRVNKHRQYSKIKLDDIKNNYFYFPLNRYQFYYRNDKGNPGNVSIGAYEEAIIISNIHHIRIDGIDTYGPGGKKTSGGSSGKKLVTLKNNAHHITISNMTISYGNSFGIHADKTTNNIIYSKITAHDNGSTGIYMNSNGGKIINCISYNNGRLDTDKGDRGGIGSFEGSNLLITNNDVYHNGPNNSNADFEISIVGTGAVEIKNNYIHDCLQGCLQIAEGGDNSIIAYNIISKYGTASGKAPSAGKFSGIRIGGGIGGAKNIKVVNNVIHGGQQPYASSEAALYVAPYINTGLHIQNNIFSRNKNKNLCIHRNSITDNLLISNNIYSNNEYDIGINWKGEDIKSLKKWELNTGHDKNSYVTDALFVNKSNSYEYYDDFQLKKTSPAINNGIMLEVKRNFINQVVPNGSSPDIGAYKFYLQ